MYKGTNLITNKGLGVQLTNSMSFCESVFSAVLIHKTVKVGLDVRLNCAYPPWNEHKKVLEDTRGHQPHLQAA